MSRRLTFYSIKIPSESLIIFIVFKRILLG